MTGIKLNLGSIVIDREDWVRLKKSGYNRKDIRSAIINAGEEELACLCFVIETLLMKRKKEIETWRNSDERND